MTLCFAAYGFLIAERATFPPSRSRHHGKLTTVDISPGQRSEDAPPGPERHVPNSLATLRRRLTLALVKHLPRCPCCAAERVTESTTQFMTQ
jgi:hypothetical protein